MVIYLGSRNVGLCVEKEHDIHKKEWCTCDQNCGQIKGLVVMNKLLLFSSKTFIFLKSKVNFAFQL